MIQRTLYLAVACFFCFSAFSNAQELTSQGTISYTYDGTLTQNDIDQGTLYGAPNDIDLMNEGLTYMDQIIDNNVTAYTGGTGREWQTTLGCLNASEANGGDGSWAGTSGGSCANIGTNGDGAIRFGYNQTIVAQTQSAIADALKVAGITVIGYRWQWKVKNYNANEQVGSPQDPLYVRVTVKDPSGNVLDEREWDYSYSIATWEQKYGMHWYDPFVSGDKIDTITLEVEGKDAGFWAGWYGPEFREAAIYSLMVVEPLDPCGQIPIVDPTCEGFIGEVPAEDPAVKELVIIDSTGSIPLSEDELAVLESLEENTSTQETVLEIVEEKQELDSSIDALSVARNAEVNALNDATSTINNTLSATNLALSNDIQQSQETSQQSQQQSQQSMNEAMSAAGLEVISNDGSIDPNNIVNISNKAAVELEIEVDNFTEIDAVDTAITEALMNLLNLERSVLKDQFEEDEQEEELTESVSNEQEDELVAAALAGDNSEEAQAALLGYNPNFRAYQQPQIADADFYKPKEIYPNQKNYDNPNSRLFNGASDATHREMVRQQYEGN